MYPVIPQVVHQSGPCFQSRAEEIEHMVVVGSVVRQFREGITLWQIASEGFVIDLPDPATLALNVVYLFKLSPKEGSVEL